MRAGIRQEARQVRQAAGQEVGEGEEVKNMFKRHHHASLPLVAGALALIAVFFPASAFGSATPSPQWTVTAFSAPTNLAPGPGSTGVYKVQVQNTGGAPSDGTITVMDVLPPGLKAAATATGDDWQMGTEMACAGSSCTYSGSVAVDDFLELKIPVEVQEGAPSSVTNLVTVTGGGAPEVVRETPTVISSTPAEFGLAPGSTAIALSSTQAGGHPDLTSTLAFTSIGKGLLAGDPDESGLVLPPGFVGDLADTPKCPLAKFTEIEEGNNVPLECSLGTQIGTATVNLSLGDAIQSRETVPVFNLSTNPGEIAKFGFSAVGYGIEGTVTLEPSDYGVRTNFQSINDNFLQFDGISLTVWGVPADPSHDRMRGLVCGYRAGGCVYDSPTAADVGYPLGYPEASQPQIDGQPSTSPPVPYLTSPTQCTGEPLQGTYVAT
ncbi:MAG TPA: hypothetical protein VNY52_03635, partial [Solirubrobacteraceae bacterium]|nr:hypothetical protein [Solirubrobacteraceae bacterium]